MANNKDKKILNVPALRFPEFTDEWIFAPLYDYLEVNRERNRNDEFDKGAVLSVSGDYGIVNQIQLLGRSFAGSSVKDYHVVRKGNIVYTKSPLKEYPYGIVKVNKGNEGIVSTLYAVYNVKHNAVGGFIESYFALPKRTNRYFKPIVRIGAKHDMKIGNEEAIANIVCFPSHAEQRKIAAFLSLLDQRISIQNKIIEKYESLIQAIIYKTKINGITKGSWQKMELSKVLYERNEKNVDGRTICSVSVSQGVVNQVEYLGRSFAAKQTNHYNVVKYGDIVYTKSPTGDFPYGIIKRSDIEEDVAVSPLYGVYTPSNDNIGVILHFYFMKPSNAFNYLHPLIQKGAKNTINITNLRFLENFVPLPISENEAYTIATTLKTIQKKIDIEKRLLQVYMIEKEYLLCQMFI